MKYPTDKQIVETWCNEPAPFLEMVRAFHKRDNCIAPSSLTTLSKALNIPIAELFGTLSFYHFLDDNPSTYNLNRVCDGPVCSLNGKSESLDALQGKIGLPISCAGRCDEPLAVMRNREVFVWDKNDRLKRPTSRPPIPNPGGYDECVFASIREDSRATLGGYLRSGGYDALKLAFNKHVPHDLLETIKKSGLVGKGGAGFQTVKKWEAVANAKGEQKTIVCNGDEGEPGCFKDRAVLLHDPHAVIEGMILTAYATGANQGFVYLRYEYDDARLVFEQAIAEAEQAGLLGEQIHGKDFTFKLYLRSGAGSYLCGEETALLNSLEGKHPFVRNRPPFPVTRGFEGRPTLVHNVETLASIPKIIAKGSEWYQKLGLGYHAGTKLISLSGDILRPGNYEVPVGLPLKNLLYDWGLGVGDGRSVQAVTMAGISGGFLAGPDLDITLDDPCIRNKGSFLGAGGIIVFDDSRDMVGVARGAIAFFARESCGKCFPCRLGTNRLNELLEFNGSQSSWDAWKKEITRICGAMQNLSACGLGSSVPMVVMSLLKYFRDQVEPHFGK